MAPTITEVCALAKKHLGQDDPQVVQLVLAAAVSVVDHGDPFWPMLIGPSSAGKSTITHLTRNIAQELDDPTLPGLLSQDRSTKQPVGVLIRAGRQGFIVIPDFSTILAMSNMGARDQLFAHLRKIYDGRTSRDMAGEHVEWEGKMTVVAACTPAIDTFHTYASELGTRFVYLRFHARDLASKTTSLQSARRRAFSIVDVQQAAARLVDASRLRLTDVDLSDALYDRLDAAALVCCYGRTSVPRDSRTREVIGQGTTEEPFRVHNQLVILARCAVALGLTEIAAGDLACRVARDSMPVGRRAALSYLVQAPEPILSTDLEHSMHTSWTVANRELEDLFYAHIVRYDEKENGSGRKWYISETYSPLVASVFNGP